MAEPIGALRVELAATAAKFEDDMKRARKAAKDAAGGIDLDFSKVGASALKMGKEVAKIGAVVTVAAGGLYYLVKQALQSAEAIADNAKSTALSVKSYQELSYAASLAGISAEGFNGAMGRLAKGISDARNGTGALVTAFKDANPQLLQSVRGAKSVEEGLYLILNAADKLGPGISQTGMLATAFGRAVGPDMARLIEDGVAGLDKLRAEANAVGAVLSDDLVLSAAEASDQLDRMEKIISVNLIRAVATFSPEIMALSQAFIDGLPTLIRWVQEFATWIGLISNPNQIQIDAITAQITQLESQLRGMKGRILDPDQFLIRSADIQERLDALRAYRAELANRKLPVPQIIQSPKIEDAGGGPVGDPEQLKKIKEFLAALEFEQDNLKRASYEQEVYNEVKKAGITDIDEFLGVHGDLVRGILAERRAKEELKRTEADYDKQLASAQDLVNDNLDKNQKLVVAQNNLLALKPALIDILGDEEQANTVLAKAMQKVKDESNGVGDAAKELGLTFTSAFEDAVAGGKKLSEIVNSLANDIMKLFVRKTVTEPLFDVLGGVFKAGLGSLMASAHGNVFSGGRVVPFASGGVVGGTSFFPMAGGKTGMMGEAGAEAIMPLTRIGGDLGVSAEGLGGQIVNVSVINNTDKKAKVEDGRDGNGNREIRVIVGEMVADDIRSGGRVSKSISETYGISRRTMGR